MSKLAFFLLSFLFNFFSFPIQANDSFSFTITEVIPEVIQSVDDEVEVKLNVQNLPSDSYFRVGFKKSGSNIYFGKILNNNNQWVEIEPLSSENCVNYYKVEKESEEVILKIKLGEEVDAGKYLIRGHRLTISCESNSPSSNEKEIEFKLQETNLPTKDPTNTPTETPTPEPTKEPEDNKPKINAKISKNIKVGVMFYVDYSLENFEPNSKHRLKVRIGQETSKMTLGQTKSGDEWLNDTLPWTLFPEIEIDENGKKSGTLRARIKEGSSEGDYYLRVVASDEDKKQIKSENYKISVGAGPVPTPTPESTATNTPSITPTKTPTLTPTLTLTPTPEEEYDKVLGDVDDKNNQNQQGQYLGEATKAKTPLDQNKLIAGGTISFGGFLIAGAGLSSKIKNIFDMIREWQK